MTLYKKNILHNQNKNSSQLVSDIPLGCVCTQTICTNNMYKQQTTGQVKKEKRKKKFKQKQKQNEREKLECAQI